MLTADPDDDVNKTECNEFCEQRDLETCHCTGQPIKTYMYMYIYD